MEARIDISNVKYLEDFFSELSLFDQKKIFMDAFRRASKPLVQRIKTGTPVASGGLLRSVGTKAVPDEIAIFVGAMRPKGSHGHLIEDGTADRYYQSKNGKPHRTGKIVGIHFVEKAYDAGTEREVENAINDSYYTAIDNAVVRVNKKMR